MSRKKKAVEQQELHELAVQSVKDKERELSEAIEAHDEYLCTGKGDGASLDAKVKRVRGELDECRAAAGEATGDREQASGGGDGEGDRLQAAGSRGEGSTDEMLAEAGVAARELSRGMGAVDLLVESVNVWGLLDVPVARVLGDIERRPDMGAARVITLTISIEPGGASPNGRGLSVNSGCSFKLPERKGKSDGTAAELVLCAGGGLARAGSSPTEIEAWAEEQEEARLRGDASARHAGDREQAPGGEGEGENHGGTEGREEQNAREDDRPSGGLARAGSSPTEIEAWAEEREEARLRGDASARHAGDREQAPGGEGEGENHGGTEGREEQNAREDDRPSGEGVPANLPGELSALWSWNEEEGNGWRIDVEALMAAAAAADPVRMQRQGCTKEEMVELQMVEAQQEALAVWGLIGRYCELSGVGGDVPGLEELCEAIAGASGSRASESLEELKRSLHRLEHLLDYETLPGYGLINWALGGDLWDVWSKEPPSESTVGSFPSVVAKAKARAAVLGETEGKKKKGRRKKASAGAGSG